MAEPIRIGINGFGRIGRQTLRAWLKYHRDDFVVTAVNDPSPPDFQAHLIQFDSVYGPLEADVSANGSTLRVDGQEIASRCPGTRSHYSSGRRC